VRRRAKRHVQRQAPQPAPPARSPSWPTRPLRGKLARRVAALVARRFPRAAPCRAARATASSRRRQRQPRRRAPARRAGTQRGIGKRTHVRGEPARRRHGRRARRRAQQELRPLPISCGHDRQAAGHRFQRRVRQRIVERGSTNVSGRAENGLGSTCGGRERGSARRVRLASRREAVEVLVLADHDSRAGGQASQRLYRVATPLAARIRNRPAADDGVGGIPSRSRTAAAVRASPGWTGLPRRPPFVDDVPAFCSARRSAADLVAHHARSCR